MSDETPTLEDLRQTILRLHGLDPGKGNVKLIAQEIVSRLVPVFDQIDEIKQQQSHVD